MTEVVVKLSRIELAVRLYAAMNEIARPDGFTARQALEALSEKGQGMLLRAADAALEYFNEQAVAAAPGSVDFVRPEDLQ